MSTSPYLSVVMSVYNGADKLEKTVNSILDQSYRDFEFIIINDGSTDRSFELLQAFAQQDQRITLIDQTNQGLTRSLIIACEQARGKYIARQDVGDYSFPDRFEKQLEYFENNSQLVAVFTNFQVIDKNNTVISQHQPTPEHIKSVLDYSDGKIATPSHHGSSMFVVNAYFKAGGYRPEFLFAQDLDLWIRMHELGEIDVIDETLYQALLSSDTISGQHHRQQKKYHDIIVESARIRNHQADEQDVLKRAAAVRASTNKLILNADQSSTLYFMASCLLPKNPDIARNYLKQAIKKNPFNLKAWYKLLVGIND